MTLADLEARRAAIPDDDALPASATQADLARVREQRRVLDVRLTQARDATATLAAIADDAADVAWLADLNTWRKTLCTELLDIKSPIRDKVLLGRSRNLTMSIRTIDFTGDQFKDSGWTLESSRLGELMIASGFTLHDADPSTNYAGRLPFHGSIKDVEKRMHARATQRTRAQQALADALLDDDVREQQEAADQAGRDAVNRLHIVVGDDGKSLVAYRNRQDYRDGRVYAVDEMDATTRDAFTRMQASYFMKPEPVTS